MSAALVSTLTKQVAKCNCLGSALFARPRNCNSRMHETSSILRATGSHDPERRQQPPEGLAAAAPDPQFTILEESVVAQRYLTLYNRVVQFPPHDGQAKGPVHEFDVVGHPRADFHYSVVFPYHTQDESVTLIREYAQGVHELVWCLPTGAFDPRKHDSYEACARAEMSEEARLAGGTWLPLMAEGHPGIPEVKWCRNRFHAYLVLDPEPDEQPGNRDAEEFIQICRVPLSDLKRYMLSGAMLLPSITTCYMATERIQELQQQGQLPRSNPGLAAAG